MSENEKFTHQELQEFSEKLGAWGESLSAREQMLLTVLLDRSEEESEENDDVEGYGWFPMMNWVAPNFGSISMLLLSVRADCGGPDGVQAHPRPVGGSMGIEDDGDSEGLLGGGIMMN